jgi:FKBP-type peptidyl-prolyl cis-trans isomerase
MTDLPRRIHRLPGLALLYPALLVLSAHAAEAPQPSGTSPGATASASAPAPAPAPAHKNEAASYSLGLSFATQWRDSGMEGMLSEDDLVRGIRAALAGTPLTPEDRQRAGAFMREAYESWAGRNQAAAKEFLAHNATQPGVKTMPSGLQYVVKTAGDPKAPTAGVGDRVTVQYRGRLINGTEFDSTYSRGKPGVIRPADAIAGWREALGMMTPGAQWRVYVPPELAYAMSPPPSIPPNSLLVFDIEVLSINHGDAVQAPTARPAARPASRPTAQ